MKAIFITADPAERQYAANKFYVVEEDTPQHCTLRCVYCENDIDHFVVASKKNKWFSTDTVQLLRADEAHLKDMIVFENEAEAAAEGFHSRRAAAEHKPEQAERVRARGKG